MFSLDTASATPTFNRHQRRALNALRYSKPVNGVAHDTLTAGAFELLKGLLEGYGNVLSEPHEAALYALLGLFTKSAQRKLRGRYAFPLPTGCAKTTAVIAWCAMVAALGYDHISVSIAASKVEALCELKRALIAQGVPADKIGLLHSYRHDPAKVTQGRSMPDGFASEPATADNDSRQFMLVTHQRVRTAAGLNLFNTYRGKPRDLLIYDESLLASDSVGLTVGLLRADAAWVAARATTQPSFKKLADYLAQCLSIIDEELARQKVHAVTAPPALTLPPLADPEMAELKALLSRHPLLSEANALLGIAREQVRVLASGEDGVLWYEVSVPAELRNIVILDASFPIRKLTRLDKTIHDAERVLPELKRLGASLSALKRYDDVTVYQWFRGGGRGAMTDDFAQPVGKREVAREIVEVVRSVPVDESILVFVFKARGGSDKVDFAKTLLRDLEEAGIDTQARTPQGKPRINVLTWGNETSLNDYAHCAHVVLAGVLQRSSIDLAASYVGQVNDLSARVTQDQVKDLALSEVCHLVYQALSRGSCRVIDKGRAKRMTAYIVHKDIGIRPVLSGVMPGVHWRTWETKRAEKDRGVIAQLAAKIAEHLSTLPPEVDAVSVRDLKKAPGLGECHDSVFKKARDKALSLVPWSLSGRTLVRNATP